MDHADIDLSLIVAMTPERVIGLKGRLPWRMPSDLARFKKITTEIGVVVMGRKTFDSILARNGKPLSGRQHVVLTTNPALFTSHQGQVWYATSLEEVLATIGVLGGRACVIGGAEIYEMFISAGLVRKVYRTIVHAQGLAGDAFFPQFVREANKWRLADGVLRSRQHEKDEYESSFWTYEWM